MKRLFTIISITILLIGTITGCTNSASSKPTASEDIKSNIGSSGEDNQTEGNFDTANFISVISREDGSGTRGAFIELFGIEEKDTDGNKIDNTTQEAIIANKTDIMLTNVASDEYAIGYVSLGSLNDTVKALNIDGVEASVENIKNSTYKVSRPFNIAVKKELSEAASDFITYILSKEGQAVIEENGYIQAVENAKNYKGKQSSGKIVIAGSSSVTPVMEKLKEAYLIVNPNVSIEIQQNDSTTGMQAAIDGTCDIGMASRDLKDTELEVLNPVVIGIDGIAVIVNHANSAINLTSDQVKSIFTGETTTWQLQE